MHAEYTYNGRSDGNARHRRRCHRKATKAWTASRDNVLGPGTSSECFASGNELPFILKPFVSREGCAGSGHTVAFLEDWEATVEGRSASAESESDGSARSDPCGVRAGQKDEKMRCVPGNPGRMRPRSLPSVRQRPFPSIVQWRGSDWKRR